MISEQDRELLLEYAAKNRQIKQLEEEQKLVKYKVLDLIQQLRGDTGKPVKLGGTDLQFTLGNRPTWVYTPAISAMEEAVKAAKKEEQQLGYATKEDNFYPIVSEVETDDTPTIS